jgi:hypothetical protein
MTTDQKIMTVIAVYITAAVICFGPAMVESARAEQEAYMVCLARSPQAYYCGQGGAVVEAAVKVMFWPLWLSYRIAK